MKKLVDILDVKGNETVKSNKTVKTEATNKELQLKNEEVGIEKIKQDIEKYVEFSDKLAELKKLEEEYKERIKEYMTRNNLSVLDTDKVVLMLKKTSRSQFLTERFKKEHTDLYNAYCETKDVVTLVKNKK